MALVSTEAGRGLRELVARGVGASHPRILEAFEVIPREVFVPGDLASRAYEDQALPIGLEQTISQPSMIALMLIALDLSPRHRVLEVGSGSGYVLALLSHIGCEVFGVERLPELADRARDTLRALNVTGVVIDNADGSAGLPQHAPYDRILVSAGASQIPDALVAQLAEGGRLVMPVGDSERQTLVTCERDDKGTLHYRAGARCVFVPLVSHDALG